jgi:serine/threonine-protein kinase
MDLPAALGTVLADKYRLLRVIGSGGAGVVYEAEQITLSRVVAVKLLRATSAAGTERFRAEALAASRINHPNAVTIYEYGLTGGGLPFLVMELLRGQSLSRLIDAGALTLGRTIRIAAQMLLALEEAHACGVIHRDLKSDNVVVEPLRTGDDLVKVIDFGLARVVDLAPQGGGPIAGTPEYMAPEQIRGQAVGPAADLYACGATLYEMVVGKAPFAGGRLPDILHAQLHTTPTPPHLLVPSCPEVLSTLILWALAKEPDQRPASAAQMRQALLEIPLPHDAAHCRLCREEIPPGRDECPRCGPVSRRPAGGRPMHRTMNWGGAPPVSARRTTQLGLRAIQPNLRLPRASADHGRRFIGRSQELGELRRFYQAREPAVLAIIGPTGAGKARLALEAACAMSADHTTLFSGPDPSGLRQSWYPVLAVLSAALDLPATPGYRELVAAVAGCGLPERDAPGLAILFGIPGPLDDAEPAVRRREAGSAAVHALRSLGQRRPGTVLCFTDLDRHDQASQEFVRTFAGMLSGNQLRIVVTAEEPRLAPPGAAVLPLPALAPAEASELARTLLADPGALPGTELLMTRTGGLPAAIEHLVGWIADGHRAEDAPAPLPALIEARINALPAEARRTLQAIATRGTVMTASTLGSVLGTAPGAGLDDLLSRGLAMEHGGELVLCDRLLAEVAAASTPHDVRRGLHARNLSCAEDAGWSLTLAAFHAASAGQYERAHGDFLRAGDDAQRRFDPAGAALCYSHGMAAAMHLLRGGDDDAATAVVAAAVRLAAALRETGETGLAEGVLAEAALLQNRPGDLAHIVREQGRLAAQRGQLEGAAALLRRAALHALRTGVRELLCDIYLDLAHCLRQAGQPQAAATELEQAVDILTLGEGMAGHDAVPRLWLLGLRLAEAHLDAGRLDTAARVATQALATGGAASSTASARLHTVLARISEASGDRDGASAHRNQAIAASRSLGDRRSTADLLRDLARSESQLRLSTSTGEARLLPPDEALRMATELAEEVEWDRSSTGPSS